MTGCYRRATPFIMSLMMAFMLPLTFYIMVASPVSDCGCFGDFIRLSNTMTFLKNVAITAGLVYIWTKNKRLDGIFRPGVQWIVASICGIYALTVGLVGYNVQPMVDFRSFAAGTSLSPADALDDEDVEFEFIYSRGNEQRTFREDNLPDSTWTFVDRRIVEGSADETHSELNIMDHEGRMLLPRRFRRKGSR